MRPSDMPDPDAVEVRIGCDRDNEAEESRSVLRREACMKGEPMPTFDACPTCGGRGWYRALYGKQRETCPTCHGTGVK